MKNKGFTLIELLIVIIIIGILATLIFANFGGVRQRGRDAQRKSDLKQIQTALELFRADNKAYPPPSSLGGWCTQITTTNPIWKADVYDRLTPYYIKTMPTDPSYANTNKDYFYWKVDQSSYRLYAVLENTKDADARPGILGLDGGSGCAGYNSSYNYKVQNP